MCVSREREIYNVCMVHKDSMNDDGMCVCVCVCVCVNIHKYTLDK